MIISPSPWVNTNYIPSSFYPSPGAIFVNFNLLKSIWQSYPKHIFQMFTVSQFMQSKCLRSTGCPVKLSTLWFCCFLGFHITYRRTSDHFSIAQEMRISKLTLLYFLDEKLIKLQHKTWDKLDFESIILMADFASS